MESWCIGEYNINCHVHRYIQFEALSCIVHRRPKTTRLRYFRLESSSKRVSIHRHDVVHYAVARSRSIYQVFVADKKWNTRVRHPYQRTPLTTFNLAKQLDPHSPVDISDPIERINSCRPEGIVFRKGALYSPIRVVSVYRYQGRNSAQVDTCCDQSRGNDYSDPIEQFSSATIYSFLVLLHFRASFWNPGKFYVNCTGGNTWKRHVT